MPTSLHPGTTARLLPGAPVADRLLTDVRARVQALRERGTTPVAGAITPRVGGVGPTTVAMLFHNAITAAELATNRS